MVKEHYWSQFKAAFPQQGFMQGLIFCSVTELANRQIKRQSTYESIYSIQTTEQKKLGTKTAPAAWVSRYLLTI